MKKVSLFFAALLFCFVTSYAQMADPNAPLTNDQAVRIGKLDNGMTYFIRHNSKPAQRAEFYLYTDVGAIQENEKQAGLAHFLEHMCLNGTKNFPGNSMISYFETIGAKFGQNINAGTGVEATSYMLNNMPIIRESILDTCLLVMHDYANFVTNDPKDINEERGIIIEELRTRRTPEWRMFEQCLPILYKGSKYATCNLIGTVEGLSTFEPIEVNNFYKTWYRPDLQAVIVVGDVDVDQVEAKLKALFADIPAPTTPNPKKKILIPENDEPIVGIITDPEARSSSVEIYYKSDPLPREIRTTGQAYLINMLEDLVSYMCYDRFEELAKQADAPFLSASMGFYGISKSCDVTSFSVNFKDGEYETAFKALMEEVEKIKRFGFSDAELERAKTNYLRRLERNAENADDRKNAELVQGMIDFFADNKPILDPAYELQVASGYLPLIQAAMINQVMAQAFPEENRVVFYSGPSREGLVNPTEAQILGIIKAAEEAELEAYKEDIPDAPLVDETTLKPGTITAEAIAPYGSTSFTLSNGVKVVVKPTTLKKDEIILSAYMEGGRSILDPEDIPSVEANVWTLWTNAQGVGPFTASALSKVLTGKIAYVNYDLNGYSHGFKGSASPQDLETWFQLMHAMVVTPRFEEKEFTPAIAQAKAVVPNLSKQPGFIFQTHYSNQMWSDPTYRKIISVEMLDQISFERIVNAQKKLYSTVDGMTLLIVGNVDMASLKPMLEKYVASLPVKGSSSKWADDGASLCKGQNVDHFTVPMETAKTSVCRVFNIPIKYSLESDLQVGAMRYVMEMTYIETLREGEGGTYGASVFSQLLNRPEEEAMFLVIFDTDPNKAEKMQEKVMEGLRKLAEEGPSADDVLKAKESFIKDFQENQITNSYWITALQDNIRDNRDDFTKYVETVNEVVTAKNIQKIAKEFYKTKNSLDVMMSPAQ